MAAWFWTVPSIEWCSKLLIGITFLIVFETVIMVFSNIGVLSVIFVLLSEYIRYLLLEISRLIPLKQTAIVLDDLLTFILMPMVLDQ